MKGAWLLSWRHLRHHRAQTVILMACIAVAVFLPSATRLLVDRYEAELTARARGTPLIGGAKGNRFDLVMAGLYFRRADLEPIPWTQVEVIAESGLGVPIPINARHTARGRPVVGTTPEYYELRRLRAADGTLPLRLGDVTLGATVAAELGLAAGDALFSDQRELYDISKPPALKMYVAGVLAESGTPDDDVVFVDVRTTWILEGLVHGHQAADEVDESMVLGGNEERVHLSPALIPYHEVTEENLQSFHYHGTSDALPLSAIIVEPKDLKSRTLLRSRFNVSKQWQMLVPEVVVDELMGFVFRVKAFLDGYSGVLAAITVLLIGLVIALSVRLRAREMLTLNRIGCSRSMVTRLLATELFFVVLIAVMLAGAAIITLHLSVPDLSRLLS